MVLNAFFSFPLNSTLIRAGSFQNMLKHVCCVVADEVILDSKLRGCSCDKPKIYRSVVTSNHSKTKERGKSLCRQRIMEIFPARWKGIFTLDLLYFSLLS